MTEQSVSPQTCSQHNNPEHLLTLQILKIHAIIDRLVLCATTMDSLLIGAQGSNCTDLIFGEVWQSKCRPSLSIMASNWFWHHGAVARSLSVPSLPCCPKHIIRPDKDMMLHEIGSRGYGSYSHCYPEMAPYQEGWKGISAIPSQ